MFSLLPVTIVLFTFLSYEPESMPCRFSPQQKHTRLITFSMLQRPILLLNSSEGILSVRFMGHNHRIIFKSFRLRRETSSPLLTTRLTFGMVAVVTSPPHFLYLKSGFGVQKTLFSQHLPAPS